MQIENKIYPKNQSWFLEFLQFLNFSTCLDVNVQHATHLSIRVSVQHATHLPVTLSVQHAIHPPITPSIQHASHLFITPGLTFR